MAATVERKHAGFTLVEMLASLTITALVIGVIASAVVQALRLAESGERVSARSRHLVLPIAWFRESVGMAVANGELQERSFVGDARRLSGESLRGLDGSTAGAVPFRWATDFDAASGRTRLSYQTGESPAVVVHEWEGSTAGFRYLARDQQWHEQWPPAGTLVDATARRLPLPLAVAAQFGEGRTILVALLDQQPAPPSMKGFL